MNTTPKAPQTIELYSIKDTLIGFSQPFFCHSRAVAMRQFVGSVQADSPNIANTYPENKELYFIGVMNLDTGEIKSDIEFVARAASYVQEVK